VQLLQLPALQLFGLPVALAVTLRTVVHVQRSVRLACVYLHIKSICYSMAGWQESLA
jgi:hypothetical protein